MSDHEHAVRVFSSPYARDGRRVELDGVEMRRVTAVTVHEAVHGRQEVTVTFLTSQARVEPWDVVHATAERVEVPDA